jgi:hypothetical protein
MRDVMCLVYFYIQYGPEHRQTLYIMYFFYSFALR